MKPIVLTKEADGTVRMTIDEFRRYIEDAYNQGRWDANHNYWYSTVTPNTITCADSITICSESSPKVTL